MKILILIQLDLKILLTKIRDKKWYEAPIFY